TTSSIVSTRPLPSITSQAAATSSPSVTVPPTEDFTMSDTPVRSLPTALYWSGLAALAMLMLATRFHHFGDALHLPDASMAIFLCGGLYLAARESGARVHGAFFALAALAGVIDWIAIA